MWFNEFCNETEFPFPLTSYSKFEKTDAGIRAHPLITWSKGLGGRVHKVTKFACVQDCIYDYTVGQKKTDIVLA